MIGGFLIMEDKAPNSKKILVFTFLLGLGLVISAYSLQHHLTVELQGKLMLFAILMLLSAVIV